MSNLDTTLLRLQEFIRGVNPSADLAPGSVLNELLLKVAAQIHTTIIENDLLAVSQASTVVQALESSSATFSPVIDKLASNYNVARKTGSVATGFIKVFVSANKRYFLQNRFKFIQPSLNFNYETTQAWEIVTSTPLATATNQLQLFPAVPSTTKFYFIVPVSAVAVGEETNAIKAVQNNTAFLVDPTMRFNEFLEAQAYGNFTKGENVENDVQLITRFKDGLSIKSLVSPASIRSRLMDQFTDIKAVTVLGANEYEMQRAKSNIFGISTLGSADIYVRPSTTTASKEVRCKAKLNAARTYYEVNILNTYSELAALSFSSFAALTDRLYTPVQISNVLEIAPFYSVSQITATVSREAVGLDTLRITFGYNNTITPSNAIFSASQARFSKYQTALLQFQLADMSGGTEDIEVDIVFNYPQSIATIQDYVLDDANRNVCADFLVKGVVPCYVTVSLSLLSSTINPIKASTVQSIKQDIFNYINSIPFGEDLVASRLVDICHNYEQVKKVLLPLKMFGDIILPVATRSRASSDVLHISGSDILAIPDSLENQELGVSKRTTMFFANIGAASVSDPLDAINITY